MFEFEFRCGEMTLKIGKSFMNINRTKIIRRKLTTTKKSILRDFRNEILISRRGALLDKAHKLGGQDLVKKWINLHVIGEKQKEIQKIAMERGYL